MLRFYDGERHREAIRELANTLREQATYLETELELEHYTPRSVVEASLLEAITAHRVATAQTWEEVLDEMEAASFRSMLSGFFLLASWAGFLAGLVAIVLSWFNGDKSQTALGLATASLSFASGWHLGRQPAQLPRKFGEQYRVLRAWKHQRQCPVCEFGPHLPGEGPTRCGDTPKPSV